MLSVPERAIDPTILSADVAQAIAGLEAPRGEFFDSVTFFTVSNDKPTAYDVVRKRAGVLATGVEAVASEILCWDADTSLRASVLADTVAVEQESRRQRMLEITGMREFEHPFVLTGLSELALRDRLEDDGVAIGAMRVFRDVLFQDVRTLVNFGMPPKPKQGLSKGFSLGLFGIT